MRGRTLLAQANRRRTGPARACSRIQSSFSGASDGAFLTVLSYSLGAFLISGLRASSLARLLDILSLIILSPGLFSFRLLTLSLLRSFAPSLFRSFAPPHPCAFPSAGRSIRHVLTREGPCLEPWVQQQHVASGCYSGSYSVQLLPQPRLRMARDECNVNSIQRTCAHVEKMQPCMLHLSLGRLSGLPILIADVASGQLLCQVVSRTPSFTAGNKKRGARPSAIVSNLISSTVPITNRSPWPAKTAP